MDAKWEKLPEDLDAKWGIREGGEPFIDIVLSVINRETGEARIGSIDGVEVSARRVGEEIILLDKTSYARVPGTTTENEIIAALLGRLIELDGKWGVGMIRTTVEVPTDGEFAFARA